MKDDEERDPLDEWDLAENNPSIVEKKRKNPFRLRNREVLFTYSNLNLNRISWEDIKKRFDDANAKCRIGLETHKNGVPHIHVYARAHTNFNSRNADAFDVKGYHPNIRPVTHHHARAWAYVAKENLVHDGIPDEPHPKNNRKQVQAQVFRDALNAGTHDGMLSTIREADPARYCTSFPSIKSAADYQYPRDRIPDYTNPPGLTIDTTTIPEIQTWIDEFLATSEFSTTPRAQLLTPSLTGSSSSEASTSGDSCELMESWSDLFSDGGFSEPDVREISRYAKPTSKRAKPSTNAPQARPKSLILWGRTRMGKTLLARALGKHTYFAGLFNLRAWDDECEYVILDDIQDDFRGFSYKDWLGGQFQFASTDKYMHKKNIMLKNRPAIMCCNQNPLERAPPSIDRDWIRGNCVIINVDRPVCRFNATSQP